LSFEYTRIEAERTTVEENQADPLVLDLDGDGIELSTAREGVDFDVTGDGNKEKTAFTTGDDGFLAADWNGNGMIDSGRELFGDQNGAVNGFAELSKHDSNQDEKIDQEDDIYSKLLVYRELNGDGISQANELASLADYGILSLSLKAQNAALTSNGNSITQIGSYNRQDGSKGLMGDVWLNYLA